MTLENNEGIKRLIASHKVKSSNSSQVPVFGQSDFDPDGEFFNKKAIFMAAVTVFALFPLYILL